MAEKVWVLANDAAEIKALSEAAEHLAEAAHNFSNIGDSMSSRECGRAVVRIAYWITGAFAEEKMRSLLTAAPSKR